jgi:hypothetical protein
LDDYNLKKKYIFLCLFSESPVNSSKSVFYVDEAPVMVTTATEEDNNETTAGQEKKKKHQPEGTVEYTVTLYNEKHWGLPSYFKRYLPLKTNFQERITLKEGG